MRHTRVDTNEPIETTTRTLPFLPFSPSAPPVLPYLVVNRDEDLVIRSTGDWEHEVGEFLLHVGVAELQPKELLEPDDGVLGLHVDLVRGGASDETLRRAGTVKRSGKRRDGGNEREREVMR